MVAIPGEAMVCIEVKGGLVIYDGNNDSWSQNGKKMEKRPDQQASSSAHALAQSYSDLIAGMPVGWGVCFPDGDLKDRDHLPTLLTRHQIIDQLDLQ